MNGFDEDVAPLEAPGRTSRGDRAFVGDAERIFVYRALAVQARAGVPASEAAARIAELFEERGEEQGADVRRRRAIRNGAQRIAKALVEAEERGGARLLGQIFEANGLILSDEELAAFAVPYDRVLSARLADLFTEAAGFLRDAGRS